MFQCATLSFFCIILSIKSFDCQLTATITYEYFSSLSNYTNVTRDIQINGIVSSKGSQSVVNPSQTFIWMTKNGNFDGCQSALNPKIYTNSIAIIQRGGDCTFSVKITYAREYGARGVIIYDPKNNGQDIFDMLQNQSDIVAVYVQRSIGASLFNLASDNQTYLNISIVPTNFDYNYDRGSLWYNSRGAIIFLVISVCILLFLCLSWFIFYSCQRYRLRTSKDRLEKRLINAAKKALLKIPLITIQENSFRDESCVICLDSLKIGDNVRQLMCGHTFHQNCVDSWLINHRHCPLCNLDILAAYRVSIPKTTTTTTTNRRHRETIHSETIPQSTTTAAAVPIVSTDQQMMVPIPSISGLIKDERHGKGNATFLNDDH